MGGWAGLMPKSPRFPPTSFSAGQPRPRVDAVSSTPGRRPGPGLADRTDQFVPRRLLGRVSRRLAQAGAGCQPPRPQAGAGARPRSGHGRRRGGRGRRRRGGGGQQFAGVTSASTAPNFGRRARLQHVMQ